MTLRRIAYVVNCFPKVSQTFVENEIAELRRRDVDVRLLSLRPPADEPRHEILSAHGVHYDTQEFTSLLRTFRPQLVHAHFATEPTTAARTLAADLDVPFTFTAHGYDVYRRPPRDLASRAAAAAAVVTVSNANARHLAAVHGIDRRHIRVIPAGVDTERFRPPAIRADPPHIVSVARLVPVKNLGLLLEACRILSDRGRDYRCVIVGDGRARDELVTLRQELCLERFVDLVGAASQYEVVEWWRRAAAAVLTSKSEGMPVSLMEAAACGVPAVATAVGGVPEVVEDGVTGLLVTPGDAAGVATVLDTLLRDRRLAARLGGAGRRRVEQRFSLARQVDELVSLWSGLV